MKHQIFRAHERNQSEPAVRRQGPAARAEIFDNENRDCRSRQDDSEFQHVARFAPQRFCINHQVKTKFVPLDSSAALEVYSQKRLEIENGQRSANP